jgi:D-alanyl-D-alanine carboxypeptidase (penicillin-binding protein 5/6)
MNAEAQHLGLTETYFLNGTGLDLDVEVSGAYGSARDVAVLATAFMTRHPEYFSATAQQTVTLTVEGRTIEASSTATPLISTPGFIGAKTGYTDLAGGNLVAAFDIAVGHPLIAVVLGSTRDGRFEDMHLLIEASREALANHE